MDKEVFSRVKREVLRQYYEEGKTPEEIFENYYKQYSPGISLASFNRNLRNWKKKIAFDQKLLDGANLKYKFAPYASTVQVNANGEVTQAWIKQKTDREEQIDRLVEEIRKNQTPVSDVVPFRGEVEGRMLEIPLFDMHFGVSDFDTYRNTLNEILRILERGYDEIHLILGQDMLHNDDFEGRTTKGTPIEKVDMVKAWNDARSFWFTVISSAAEFSNRVVIHYSKGNHDKTISWAFVQMLKEAYPNLEFDDDLRMRKCIFWQKCFVGFGHCHAGSQNAADLFRSFILDFPKEFADSTVREIHTGHLHREGDKDEGAMVRRLSSGTKIDEWTNDNGMNGKHRRFMVFEYTPGKLSAIYYV